ncbi:hypothetical protein GTY88_28895, partial [Streptomyces sp. SID5926]|nr:hypothetical protein [Streptomyces sp. SID5926]
MPDETARHGPGHPDTPGGSGGPGGEGSEAGRAAVPADDPLARLVLRLREIGRDPDAEQ